MHFILFDDHTRYRLLPFTHTRPVADIRCGILTMRERWELCLLQKTDTLTESYLAPMYPAGDGENNFYVNGAVFANDVLAAAVLELTPGNKLVKGDQLIAARTQEQPKNLHDFLAMLPAMPEVQFQGEVMRLQHVWGIFAHNDAAIRLDFGLVTRGRESAPIPEGVTVSGNQIFIEEGANIYPGCIINTQTGPVYIGKAAEVLEGTLMRGPIAIGDHGVIKMGAKLYGATTIGPGSKVGGENNNVVFFANSNKSHDGYLGNAVIGEWCNLGADTNCSNLKNNYDEIKIWDEYSLKSIHTGLTFCGLLMGDHSKCGINTMFNTGTVVGVSCNIFGGGFPEKFIPSFSWGGADGITTYRFERAMETANRMMARRGRQMSPEEISMYRYLFDNSQGQRNLFMNNDIKTIE
jgi:UDP-N-acetylglucosamine diphosphorylase/glucosamine-1-phosphate N-acetyltransferase